MRLELPRLFSRHMRLTIALSIAIGFAATQAIAQYGSFSSAHEGELWGVRQELNLNDAGESAGMAYINGLLFVADQLNETVVAFDSSGATVTPANAEWGGFTPGELAGATVSIDGIDTQALLVSDAGAHRMLAYNLAGAHLFTMTLERPTFEGATGSLRALAMGPGARFVLSTGTPTLALEGSFAAAWTNAWETAGAVLAYRNIAAIDYDGTHFRPTPTATLDGVEGNNLARPGQVVYGLVFDPAGNIYIIDTNTERLNVYDENFAHRFTFGTPAVNGTLEEFEQPYGIAYSPADGGRLFIADSDHFRVQIYKPNLVNSTLDYVSTIARFGADGLPRSVAIDAATGRLAVSGLYTGHLWILDRPDLAAFDLQFLDSGGGLVEEVCAGASYRVRFSLTVPPGRAPVNGIVPQLAIDGDPVAVTPAPGAVYSDPMTAGQVATYTYQLEMPAVVPAGAFVVTAGATASTTDVLAAAARLQGVNCVGALPTITASPNIPAQVSGWTPVRPDQTFALTFNASDAEGVASIEYQISGQNNLGTTLAPVPNPTPGTTQTLILPLPEFGFSTITYRAHDTDNRKSAWQTFELRSVLVQDWVSVESDSVAFTVGYPIGVGYRFFASGLPPGVTIDEGTGQISGDLSFASAGTYHVVVTEDTGPNTPTSSVGFMWTVMDVNRHPHVDQPGTINAVEGQYFELQVNASDPDGDPLWYSIAGIGRDLPGQITIDAGTGLISGTFPFNSARDYTIQVGVSECGALAPRPPCEVILPGTRLATVVNSSISVANFNRPPDIVNPGTRTNVERDLVSLQLVASDPDIASDGQVLTYRANNLPPGLSINAATGLIAGTIDYNSARSYAVTIEVDDQETDPTRFEVFTWNVTNLNRPPTASAADRTDAENDTVAFGITASDPDGEALSYSAVGMPPGISLDPATGQFTGTLTYASAGEYDVQVTVSDGTDSVVALFHWTVTNTNAPPAITSHGNQANAEGDSVSVAIAASDLDGQTLTYSAAGLPAGLAIDAATGVITGSLAYDTAATYTVTVSVTDGQVSRSVTFTWTVTNVNRPPVVVSPGPQSSAEGTTVLLAISASDPDGQALTYSSTGLPPGLSINPATGVIAGTIAYTAAGPYTVTVTASDGSVSDSETFAWNVSDSNRPPVCSATVSADELWPPNHKPRYLSLTGISDPDGDALTIRYTGILQDEPVDSAGQGNTPNFDGGIEDNGARAWVRSERTGNAGDGRVYLISYTATDAAGASCSGTTNLALPHDQRGTPAVLSPGRWNSLDGQLVYAPAPDAVNDTASVNEDKAITMSVLGNDVTNYQAVVVSLVGVPSEGTATTNGQTITYQAPPAKGTATLTYRVTGPFGTDTATVTITIK